MERIMRKVQEAQVMYIRTDFDCIKITKSIQVHDLFKQIYEPWQLTTREYFLTLYLNSQNEIISYYKASEGGVTGTIADGRLIFCEAIKSGATAIILAHNHPSNNNKPSDQDIRLTKKFIQAGKVLDILVVDHVIITPQKGYYSMSDRGDI
jgi:DNA repair protein RadC